ncbi:MgtC/SapB family protein [Luteolibacter ambystomatis]|uniref:MgtC/SapB family protein n=1 Tax=Luteolibacter ambystomatis TaxID=2824561 RepID=A0A975IYQ3_9BACT|nr:MgtC/SapB family protein [Luteolibacter ambystomatis]QUE50384.1 MgtC/SapB family protein [Luteolibacter ambystomatis]
MLGVLSFGLTAESLLRIALAVIAGGILGFERQHHGRAAGLRTIMIVCLASCVAMVVSDIFYRESFQATGTTHPDPARLAAGVLAGMGFLGAGVIVHQQKTNITRGVTTAATLWFSAIIGICFGAGAIGLGAVGTGIATVVLYFVPKFERNIQKDAYADLAVRMNQVADVETVTGAIESLDAKVKGMSWEEDLATGERFLKFHVKFKSQRSKTLPQQLMSSLSALPGVKTIHWQG